MTLRNVLPAVQARLVAEGPEVPDRLLHAKRTLRFSLPFPAPLPALGSELKRCYVMIERLRFTIQLPYFDGMVNIWYSKRGYENCLLPAQCFATKINLAF